MTSDRPGAPIIIRDASQLASVLYRRRLERGQTLANLAARIGCTVQRVSLWLRGNQVPQADGLVKLADALGYDLALIPREDAP
jgi:transcriptional regulator with XRE-family HTH domain